MKNLNSVHFLSINGFVKLFIAVLMSGFLHACYADSNDAKKMTTNSPSANSASPTTLNNAPPLLHSTYTSKSHSSEVSGNRKSQFETVTGLILPADTKILFYESAEGSDQMVRMIVEMKSSDFKVWIANVYLELEHFSEEKRYLLGKNNGEWQPQNPSKLPVAQVSFENAKTLNIGYEKITSENLKVYLVFHGS